LRPYFQHLLARQLSRPSGVIGRFALGSIWNKRNAALNDATLASLELQDDDRVLDIGFGGGYLLDKMAEKVHCGLIAGIDSSPAMVENARRRFRRAIRTGKMEIRCAQVEAIPYPGETFSKVSSVNSIFYWSDPAAGLAEIYRVLDVNGWLVLTFTCRQDLANKGFVKHGLHLFDESDMQTMLARGGFNDLHASIATDRHRRFLCMIGRKLPHHAQTRPASF
jgi:ubiquinone/menaquinone biosynthesis C-methylase UbiE